MAAEDRFDYPSSTSDGEPDVAEEVELGVDGVNPVSPNNPPPKALDRLARERRQQVGMTHKDDPSGQDLTAAGVPVDEAPEPAGEWSETNITGHVETPAPSASVADEPVDTSGEKDVDQMSYQELRSELGAADQDTSGDTKTLRARLKAYRESSGQ